MKKTIIYTLCFVLIAAKVLFAALGCTLNDPDRDVIKIFPQSTGYKTEFITIEEKGGIDLKNQIENKLEDKFDDIYETIDVPYAYYTILKGKDIIGRIHGVNQKGMFGGMQLILATDTKGNIIKFYYQKLSSPESKKFKDDSFTNKFIGLNVSDFYNSEELLKKIKDPSLKSNDDFKATIRGLKKNLILLDFFFLNEKHSKAGAK